jgi:hypothetical protein
MNKAAHLLALGAALLGCGSDATSAPPESEEPGLVCALDSLTGIWRVTYTEHDGDCGPVASETVDLGGSGGADPSCTYAPKKPSADRCSLEFDFTCPTTDSKGSQRWTGITRQVAEKKLISDATAQLQHPELGVCRSTYTMTWTRL